MHVCHLWQHANSKQGRKGGIESRSGSIGPSTRVSSYGLLTMNLDTLRVQHYNKAKEVKEERKKREIRFKGQ